MRHCTCGPGASWCARTDELFGVKAVEECPPNCGHRGPPEEPDCMLDVVTADGEASAGRLASLRRLLASRAGIDEPSEG